MTSVRPRQRRNAISSSSVVRQPCSGGGRSRTVAALRATRAFLMAMTGSLPSRVRIRSRMTIDSTGRAWAVNSSAGCRRNGPQPRNDTRSGVGGEAASAFCDRPRFRRGPTAKWVTGYDYGVCGAAAALRSSRTSAPAFMTNFTRSISLRSATGFPETAMMSANFPFSMLPMSFSQS